MSLRFHWFLPTNGDGRDIVGGGHGVATGTAGTIRPATLAYLGQVARTAEQLGFEAALTPTGAWCEDAWLVRLPDPVPDLYFGGSSAAAGPVAARSTDVYLTWGEPPDAVDSKLRWMDGLAREAGRTLRYGIRLHVISRDTAEEAWRQARRLIEGVDEAMIRKVQEGLAHSQSEGQRRMRELHRGSPDNLEVSPNLWAGVGLLRGGAGTALVGSHTEVADRIQEYAQLGLSEFILSGYPHLEEAYWFGEGVLPILRSRGLWAHPAPASVDTTLNATPFAPTSGPAAAAS